MLTPSALKKLLSSLTAKYSTEDTQAQRFEVLYFVAVHFFLNKEFAKSLNILSNIENSVSDKLVSNVTLLKVLINVIFNKFEDSIELISKVLIYNESKNNDFLKALYEKDTVDFLTGAKVPPFHSRQSLHLLLLLADTMLKQKKLAEADKLIQEYLKQAGLLGSNEYHAYCFLLQIELAEMTKTPQDYLGLIYAMEDLEYIFHRHEYSFMMMKLFNFLQSQNRNMELSIYELGHDLDQSTLAHGDPVEGYRLDARDLDPRTRFDPIRNPSLCPQDPDPVTLMLRIKLCPQIWGYWRSVRIE